MIDVSQWRASIGLWHYCQAASSRPANGCHSHSFKAAVDSKSGSTTSGEKTFKLPAVLPFIAFLLLFLSLFLLRHILMIPPTGNYYQVQCTTGATVTYTNYLQSVVLPGGSSSNLIYNDLYLIVCVRMLLLLSGDIELNPGPIKLVLQQTKQEMIVLAVDNYTKAANLMNVIEKELESSLNREQYLIDICHVLINQQHRALTDIATSILHQLGQSIPDNVTSISSIPDDVQGYADNMRQHYKHQLIVATDWPLRIGKDFFGRLALVEKQDSSTQADSAWHLLRGQVDKTVKLTGNKKISVEDVLQSTDSSLSLRIVIDSPPGIGKTTLCHKLLNMWSNGPLVHQ
uniref:NACHT domain-containing protein n=1 Tax=Amphimedon queenslandica TaxID=400682 RepID=A0A1X7TQU5_AMPQE